jgi:hypothetical protein
MRAYKATISKTEFVKELKAHQAADNFVRGSYWERGKGCAVGCSLEAISRIKSLKFSFDNHKLYEAHLGIPEWMARLEDSIFEGIGEQRAKVWPVEFAEAIHVGADLEKAKVPFLIMVLEHSLSSMSAAKYAAVTHPEVESAITGSIAAVEQMIKAQKSGNKADIEKARSAADSAYSAARSARSADSAAYSAYSADSAADSAYSAARSADSAYSAARSARSADSAAYSAYSARRGAFEHYADQLLKILEETKE